MLNKPFITNQFLEKIVENISISDTMDEKARKSYNVVGKWLAEGLKTYGVKIMPQGSFNLGTVIKPISEEDDYDIDLVCLLEFGHGLPDCTIKNCVGDRLKENETYRKNLEKEGKRCWTLQYGEFHMDILPCVPMCHHFSKLEHMTQIHLTQKIVPENRYIPHYSNPEGYLEWFESHMRDILLETKREAMRIRSFASIEKVPTYSVKTPLQKVVQLLKRHRDLFFKDKDSLAPISILLTTLATISYNGERDLLSALTNIVSNLHGGIVVSNGQYVVENPAFEGENFAEKWNEDKEKPKAFFEWYKQLKADVERLNTHNLLGHHHILSRSFGEKPVIYGLNSVFPNGSSDKLCLSSIVPPTVNIVKPNRPWGDPIDE